MSGFDPNTWLSTGLLSLLVKTTLLLGATAVVVRVFARASAAKRHLIWTFGLGAALLLPIFELVVPDLHFPVSLPGQSSHESSSESTHDADPNLSSVGSMEPGAMAGSHPGERRDWVGNRGRDADGNAASTTSGVEHGNAVASEIGEGFGSTPLLERAASWPWPEMLLGAWFLGSVWCLLRLFVSARSVQRLVGDSRLVTDPEWKGALERTACRLGLRRAPILLRSRETISPMVWGVRETTLLLPPSCETWTGERRDAVLAHELAHVRRRDPFVQVLARVLEAVYWFHPLVRYAVHSLEQECERACDDRVLEHGCLASEYAGHLLAVAEQLQDRRSAAVAICMARPSQLGRRVRAVLDPSRQREEVGVKYSSILALGTLATVLVFATFESAPAKLAETSGRVQVPSQTGARGAGYSYAYGVDSSGGEVVGVSSGVSSSAEESSGSSGVFVSGTVSGSGGVGVSGDGKSVFTVGHGRGHRGGHIDYSRISGTIVNESDGQTTYAWARNGRALEATLDGEIELTEDFRDVATISEGGYFLLFDSRGRDDYELEVEPDGAGGLEYSYFVDDDEREFDDDARDWFGDAMKELLDRTSAFAEQRVERVRATEGVDGVLDLVDDLESEHIKQVMIVILLDGDPVSSDDLLRIHGIAADLDSDHSRGRILGHPQNFVSGEPEVRRSLVELVSRMDSEHEQRTILERAIEGGEMDDETLELLMDIASRFDSSHEMRTFLEALASEFYREEVPTERFFDAVAAMDSDHERTRLLESLLTVRAPEETYVAVLRASMEISSDHERSQLLRAILSDMEEPSSELTRAFFQACRRIRSDHEMSAVLGRALRKESFGKEFLIEGIELVERVGSDHSKVEILSRVAETYSEDPELRAAFELAMESIHSDRAYREVQRAIGE